MTLLFSSQITHSETRHRLCGASLWDSVDKLCKQSPVFFNVAYAMEDQDPVGASCTSFIHVSQLHLFLPPHLQSVHHTNDSAKDSSELKVLTLPYNYSGVEIFVSMLRYFFFLVYGSTCIVSVYSRATICAHFNLYYHFILMSPASQRFIAHFPVSLWRHHLYSFINRFASHLAIQKRCMHCVRSSRAGRINMEHFPHHPRRLA